jgi:PAS domain S-box-containing protein
VGAFEILLEQEKTEWDPILKSLWGLEENEVPTQEKFWKGVHPEDRDRVKQALAKSAAEGGNGHYNAEYRVINHKSGKVSWIEASGQVIREGNQPPKMIGMIINITRRKELEDSLQKVVEELKQMNERKNEFLATLGHELRNPLASLSGGVELLQTEEKDKEKLLSMMARSVKQMASLLDDLLDLTRMARGQIRLKTETVNLNNLLKGVVENFQAVFQTRQQNFKFLTPKEQFFIYGDRTRLEQIFTNLLSNAHKFTPEKGKIQLELKKGEGAAIIEIKDNGKGLSEDSLDKIFEPFAQVTKEREGDQGVGIGLALVKQFVELQEGSIKVHSKGMGKGSVFTVKFPLLKAIDLPVKKEKPNRVIPDKKILIVDDNTDTLESLRMRLEKAGAKVKTAETGKEAIESMASFTPTVYLLDIGLPDMTGYDLIKKLKKLTADEAIYIAHTGYGHRYAQNISKLSGFDHHLNKPIDMDELLQLIGD